ncbi:MAG: DUF1559 domain-containing protein [Planctomycetota bacterium]|nr:DUF1559 domain-containing protein [Planctomycetota bacterium]
MRRRSVGHGFTLVELLVVIAIIGILVALLLPAIQAAREAARRTQCNNNLHNIALSLQNYHDTYKTFPMGAMHSGLWSAPAYGPSWLYGTLPFTEGRNIYDKIAATQRAGATTAPFTATLMDVQVGGALAKMVPEYMRCPSSPIPVMESQVGPIVLPTYVGISGGTDIRNNSPDYTGANASLVAPVTTRSYDNRAKATVGTGILTTSGMLPAFEQMGIANCTDGTSNTMIVGEQSDWLQDSDPTNSTKYHGDPGWSTSGAAPSTGTFGGFLTGTNGYSRVPLVSPVGSAASAAASGVCFNITTVRYRPNYKRVLGGTALGPGCAEDRATSGMNNPLQSAHAGGLLVGMTDGSVQFISQTTDLAVLLRLAIRDDGQNVQIQ